ncbi:SDR family oxidoreductase [Methylobacterium trifolii]|uniref:Cyclic-di-GMP-binding biofilm dispersal mediator protein n=1 Tax=Methylobacterium trifolii TaxID=1003092 RepID=A0ABQ4TUS0_9HYPH|nr:SDR family oxidoreductase [Methylobacterium trifolii]GJE58437.1 Cyclic-di-GMP-binding biofilm dispersal mediator protein [Methylobacterium trifolii]
MITAVGDAPKTALVYGGSRGIGAAIVSRLVEDGYAVAFTFASRADTARDLASALEARGGRATAIQADSADPAAIRTAADAAGERLGSIGLVVVNAGILKLGTVDAVSLDDLNLMIDVNIRGVFLAVQAALPHVSDGGRVVTIGSCSAEWTGFAGSSVYQFTKAAVAAMAKGLARDLAPRKITVNNVQPGPTRTDLSAGFIDTLSERSPLKRIAEPAEIAGLVSYLARAEAGFMTGASLTMDGGLTL